MKYNITYDFNINSIMNNVSQKTRDFNPTLPLLQNQNKTWAIFERGGNLTAGDSMGLINMKFSLIF